jgi:Domain of unknown function (DUF4041)/T5orf172 domain
MTFLLFLVSIGLATALVLVAKEKTQHQKHYTEIKQQLDDSSRHLQTVNRYYIDIQSQLEEANQHVQSVNQKYGGLIDREAISNELSIKISTLTDRLQLLDRQAEVEERELTAKIEVLQKKLKMLEEQEIVEAFGFYESKYDFQEAVEYKQRLDSVRSKQKKLIKDKKAAVCRTEWSVGGSVKEGKKMADNFIKLALRAFNGECDAAVIKVKYNNIQTMESRIRKCYEDLNKLSTTTHCEITSHFLDLKLKELHITHEFQEKKQEEQEEQRAIREQMREEEKALRELEKAKQDAEKEELQYQDALAKARRELEAATGQAHEKLNQQIEELQKRLIEAGTNKQRAISQAQMTKAGNVYIISNIGSFGDNIYKIGMTRRPKPYDRIKELGDASVPFPFDVHAMISCKNAPELESRLHRHFKDRRLNKANERKEFFQVSLEEVAQAVEQIDRELNTCNSEIKFTKVAEASDYRKTLAQEREFQNQKVAVAV